MFLKWAGGKQRIAKQLVEYFPPKINVYYEPFLGAGSVFFELMKQGRIKEEAILSDINTDLIWTYVIVRDVLPELLEEIRLLSCSYYHYKEKSEQATKGYYLDIRAEFNKNKTDNSVKRVAQFIFLNKTCFNGLYRVNKKGKFNVPYGQYKNPKILDIEKLELASKLLQGAVLLPGSIYDVTYDEQYKDLWTRDWDCMGRSFTAGDAAYFDPPYHKIRSTSFTSYATSEHGDEEHAELKKLFEHFKEKKMFVLMTNSGTTYVKLLYKNHKTITCKVNRSVGGGADTRKPESDLIIL